MHIYDLRKLLISTLTFAVPLQSVAMRGYAQSTSGKQPSWMQTSMSKVETELVAKYGAGQRSSLQRGMQQTANFWRAEVGDASVF